MIAARKYDTGASKCVDGTTLSERTPEATWFGSHVGEKDDLNGRSESDGCSERPRSRRQKRPDLEGARGVGASDFQRGLGDSPTR